MPPIQDLPLQVQNLLEIGLLLTALLITIDRSISRIIGLYQVQSLLLAAVTGLSVVTLRNNISGTGGIILLIIFLPLLLALVVRALLSRATISAPAETVLVGWGLRYLQRLPLLRRFQTRIRQAEELQRDAEQEWLQPEVLPRGQVSYLLVFLIILLAALLIASEVFFSTPDQSQGPIVELSRLIGLLASLVLALIGLYNMVIKQDIISQVIGLLMMDHGLYLAVVKIVPIPFPATFFVIGLYFYTLITMFMLVIVLPGVRDVTAGIKLSTIRHESNLKG